MLAEFFQKQAFHKNDFVILDLSYPDSPLEAFRKMYPRQYVSAPMQDALAPGFAAGLASLCETVLVYGHKNDFELPDSRLNVKLMEEGEVSWSELELAMNEFGFGKLLIPSLDSSNLGPHV